MNDINKLENRDAEKERIDFMREKMLLKFHPLLLEHYKESYTPKDVLFYELAKIQEEFSFNPKNVVLLFHHKEFKAIYYSKNFELKAGYTVEELYKMGIRAYFKTIYWKQLASPINAIRWERDFTKKLPEEILKTNPEGYYCGLRLRSKTGKLNTVMIRQRVLSFDKNNYPILSVLFMKEITHLYNGNHYWVRFTRGENNEYTGFYTSAGTKETYADLLSKREKEILQLISINKTSKEIGDELHISRTTVEKHRKNMLARSGAKNTTALVQLCGMCKVL